MDVHERILKEFRDLIYETREILKACGYQDGELRRWPAPDDYVRIRTRAPESRRKSAHAASVANRVAKRSIRLSGASHLVWSQCRANLVRCLQRSKNDPFR